MCEYVTRSNPESQQFPVPLGEDGIDVGGRELVSLPEVPDGFWECWHRDTRSWEAMYNPPDGMALKMSPGSKIRLNTFSPRPEHTKNAPPPEKTPVGTQMRDLIPSTSNT